MKFLQFNGGVQLLTAPHLIATNEGVIYNNIDHDKGHFAPLKDKLAVTYSTVDNFGFYDWIHEETYFTPTIYDYELYKETLYRASRIGIPEIRTALNTFINLGIEGPSAQPTVTPSGDPEDSAYFGSTRWRITINATIGGKDRTVLSKLNFQETLGVNVTPDTIVVSSNDGDKANIADLDSLTSWLSAPGTVLPQTVEFTYLASKLMKNLRITPVPSNASKVPLLPLYTGTINGETILDRDSGFTGSLNDGLKIPTVDTEIAKYTFGGSGEYNIITHASLDEAIKPTRFVMTYVEPSIGYGNNIPDKVEVRSSVGGGWLTAETRDFSGGGPWPILETSTYGDVKQLEIAWSTPVRVPFLQVVLQSRLAGQRFLITEIELYSNDYEILVKEFAPRDLVVEYYDSAWLDLTEINGQLSWDVNEQRNLTIQEELNLRSVIYAITYYNNNTGAESQPVYSDEVTVGDVDADLTSIPVSADGQVTHKRIYRIGGLLTQYTLVDTIPAADVSYTDSFTDIAIAGNAQLLSANYNQAPSGLKYLKEAYAMLFGILDDTLRYTPIGIPTAWPTLNFLDLPNNSTGIARVSLGLLIFTSNRTILVTGTGPDSLSQQILSPNIGCVSHDSIVEVNGGAIWAAKDGIYTSEGGEPIAVSKNKLGLQDYEGFVINAVYHDEKYYLQLADLPVSQPVGGLGFFDLAAAVQFDIVIFDPDLSPVGGLRNFDWSDDGLYAFYNKTNHLSGKVYRIPCAAAFDIESRTSDNDDSSTGTLYFEWADSGTRAYRIHPSVDVFQRLTSGATYTPSAVTTTQTGEATFSYSMWDFLISSDGTKLIIVDQVGILREFTMVTAWDPASIVNPDTTPDASFDFAALVSDINLNGAFKLAMSTDEEHIYIHYLEDDLASPGDSLSFVRQIDLLSSFTLTGATLNTASYATGGNANPGDVMPEDIAINDISDKLYLSYVDQGTDLGQLVTLSYESIITLVWDHKKNIMRFEDHGVNSLFVENTTLLGIIEGATAHSFYKSANNVSASFKSGWLGEGGLVQEKANDQFKIAYKGDVSITIEIPGETPYVKAFSSVLFNVEQHKMPVTITRNNYVEITISGAGEVYEISFPQESANG